MNAARIIVAAGFGIALAASPVFGRNASQKGGQQAVAIDVAQLPAAVTEAIEKAYPKSTIVSAAKINRGGQAGYELSVKTSPDAQPFAVMATADGLIRAGSKTAPPATAAPRKGARARGAAAPPPVQGETVAVNQLPKAVVQAITDAYPKDVIVDAMRIASGSQILYQLTLTDVSHILPMLVVVSTDGKIQKR